MEDFAKIVKKISDVYMARYGALGYSFRSLEEACHQHICDDANQKAKLVKIAVDLEKFFSDIGEVNETHYSPLPLFQLKYIAGLPLSQEEYQIIGVTPPADVSVEMRVEVQENLQG